MPNIYNLFKFLEKNKGTKTPIGIKFIYAPDELTDEDLNVEGDLDLAGSSITSLPDNLQVGKGLYLNNTKITSLPDNLSVGGYLILFDTLISSIPSNLKVGNNLDLRLTPLAEKYTEEEIRKMVKDKGGYIKGRIYV